MLQNLNNILVIAINRRIPSSSRGNRHPVGPSSRWDQLGSCQDGGHYLYSHLVMWCCMPKQSGPSFIVYIAIISIYCGQFSYWTQFTDCHRILVLGMLTIWKWARLHNKKWSVTYGNNYKKNCQFHSSRNSWMCFYWHKCLSLLFMKDK